MAESKPKGFRLPKQTARLKFEGDFEGAEVSCTLEVPIRRAFEYGRLAKEREAGEVDIEGQETLLRDWGDNILIEWNLLDDEGAPIPATGEGMLAVTLRFALALFGAWTASLGVVPAPFAEPSPNGVPLAEPMTMTGQLLESPPN